MGEHPVPRPPKSDNSENPNRSTRVAAEEPPVTPEQQRAIAHSRGRICKTSGCEVCAPLRERRRLKKAQRRADAQAHAHAKGEACGRSNCPVAVCVRARHADAATPGPVVPQGDGPSDDPDEMRRRQSGRHRAGLPCGVESCPNAVCVDGFAQERVRRHRARRPCRSAECTNPICASSRST